MAGFRTLAPLLLAAAVHAASPPGCQPLPGADLLWSKPGARFMLLGEMHGTAETPALFRDLVCAAHSSKRPLVVGLERSVREQSALDAFLAPSHHEAATAALLAESGWRVFDGRSSRAMLGLLEDLRTFQQNGWIAEVAAFSDTRPGEPQAQGEQRMASALLAGGRPACRRAGAGSRGQSSCLQEDPRLVSADGHAPAGRPDRLPVRGRHGRRSMEPDGRRVPAPQTPLHRRRPARRHALGECRAISRLRWRGLHRPRRHGIFPRPAERSSTARLRHPCRRLTTPRLPLISSA